MTSHRLTLCFQHDLLPRDLRVKHDRGYSEMQQAFYDAAFHNDHTRLHSTHLVSFWTPTRQGFEVGDAVAYFSDEGMAAILAAYGHFTREDAPLRATLSPYDTRVQREDEQPRWTWDPRLTLLERWVLLNLEKHQAPRSHYRMFFDQPCLTEGAYFDAALAHLVALNLLTSTTGSDESEVGAWYDLAREPA